MKWLIAPLSLIAGLAWAGSATISWTPPTTYTSGEALTPAGYNLFERCGSDGYGAPIPLPAVSSYTRDGLPDGTTCWWQLTSLDADGRESDRSSEASKVFAPVGTAPGAPSSLVITWQGQPEEPPSMAEPTLVTSVYSAPSTAAKTSGVLTVQSGDLLVVLADREASSGGHVTTSLDVSNDGAALTWTRHINVPGADDANHSMVRGWSAPITANRTVTVTVDDTFDTIMNFGALFQVWRNHGGVGNVAGDDDAGGQPSLAITTTGANSALVVAVCDWNAIDGTSRTWREGAGTLTEAGYFRDAARLTSYFGTHLDAGTAGAKAVGLTAPSGQLPAVGVIEILGTAGDSGSRARSMLLGVN